MPALTNLPLLYRVLYLTTVAANQCLPCSPLSMLTGQGLFGAYRDPGAATECRSQRGHIRTMREGLGRMPSLLYALVGLLVLPPELPRVRSSASAYDDGVGES